MFQIGDKVFYPLHGAGIINAIEEKEVLGKTREYYVIHIPISKMDVMIPIDRIQKTGIRSITDQDMMKEILDELHYDETGDTLPWKERYLLNMEKMKTGEMNDSADVVHNLLLRSKEKTLNTTERQMLNQARRNLISEIVLITNLTEDQATNLLKIS